MLQAILVIKNPPRSTLNLVGISIIISFRMVFSWTSHCRIRCHPFLGAQVELGWYFIYTFNGSGSAMDG